MMMNETQTNQQNNNPLHGITLEAMITYMAENYTWEYLADELRMNCFEHDPSIKSCLKFLRKTPWARTKAESFYLYLLREEKRINK
jgi:uncharacterized protein (DUF2132 family)